MTVKNSHVLVERLAEKHREPLRRFLRTRVRNVADVPDLIQEVFLRLLRIPNHETIRTPEAYIITVAHHVAQQHALRSATRSRTVALEEALSELTSSTELDPALEACAQESVEELERALHELSPKVKATFLLYRRDGLTMDEISARLSISRPMAKKYLVKALVHFRKRLKEME